MDKLAAIPPSKETDTELPLSQERGVQDSVWIAVVPSEQFSVNDPEYRESTAEQFISSVVESWKASDG